MIGVLYLLLVVQCSYGPHNWTYHNAEGVPVINPAKFPDMVRSVRGVSFPHNMLLLHLRLVRGAAPDDELWTFAQSHCRVVRVRAGTMYSAR